MGLISGVMLRQMEEWTSIGSVLFGHATKKASGERRVERDPPPADPRRWSIAAACRPRGPLRHLARRLGGALGAAARRGGSPGSADGSHLPAPFASAEEEVAAIGLEPRHVQAGRHIEPLHDLSRSSIDSPQVALVAFPGGVPELAVDPGDPGDEAVGLDGAENRPGLRDRPDGSSGPDTAPPRASLRPRRAPSHRRRPAPGSWRAPGRSSDRFSGCDPRRAETGAGRRRPFPHARQHRSSAPSPRSPDRRRSALSPDANQTCWPSNVTPATWSTPGKGPYSRTTSAADRFMLPILVARQRPGE